MNTLTEKTIAAHLVVVGVLLDRFATVRDDRGQASTEYAGVLFVIVAIITAVVTAAKAGIGTAIVAKITDAIAQVGV